MSVIFIGDWLPRHQLEAMSGVNIRVGNLECVFTDTASHNDKAYESTLPIDCLKHVENGGFSALSLANMFMMREWRRLIGWLSGCMPNVLRRSSLGR